MGVQPHLSFINLRFKRALNSALFEKGVFQPGEAMKIEYMFMEMNPGDQMTRHLGGFGAGKGILKISVKFFNPAEEMLAEIVVESIIQSGTAGGSIDSAIAGAAQEIYDFALTSFGR